MFDLKRLCSLILLIVCFICGCSSNVRTQDELLLNEENLVYQEEMSPNEKHIEKTEDRVVYTVKVYQLDSKDIVVSVQSNSAFFDGIQYQIASNDAISESDIDVIWTTMMGNTEAVEDDQYSFVNIVIAHNGNVFSERKINLIDGAMEIIVQVLEKNN